MDIILNENIIFNDGKIEVLKIDVETDKNLLSRILYEGKYKIVLINDQKLVVFENGTIYRANKNGNLKLVKNKFNT